MKRNWFWIFVLGILLLVSCGTNPNVNGEMVVSGQWINEEGEGTTTLLDFRTQTNVHLLIHMGGEKTVDNTFNYRISRNKITFFMPVGRRTSTFNFITPDELIIYNYMGFRNLNPVFRKFDGDLTEFATLERADDIESALANAARSIMTSLQQGNTVAIVNVSAEDIDQSEFVAHELEFILVGRGFNIVDRSQLDMIRREQNLQLSGEVDDDSIVSIGRFAGANIVITGSITGSGTTRRLRLRLLDTQTARVIAAASERF